MKKQVKRQKEDKTKKKEKKAGGIKDEVKNKNREICKTETRKV